MIFFPKVDTLILEITLSLIKSVSPKSTSGMSLHHHKQRVNCSLEYQDLIPYDICQYCRLAMKQIPFSEGPKQGGICNRTPTHHKDYRLTRWTSLCSLEDDYTCVVFVCRVLCCANEPNELLFTCLCSSGADTLGMKGVLCTRRAPQIHKCMDTHAFVLTRCCCVLDNQSLCSSCSFLPTSHCFCFFFEGCSSKKNADNC